MGNDYDDLYRPSSNPWPERETQKHLNFECKGCHTKVDSWCSQTAIDNTPGCKEFCLPCLSKQKH